MHRRRYLAAVGATLLAGCAALDGDSPRGAGGLAEPTGPPTLAFGESHLLRTGVEVACDGLETAAALEIDGETHPAPADRTWALVSVSAENVSEGPRSLPWRQALSVRLGEDRFAHDINDTPAAFLFWDRAYTGGDPVDPGVATEGVVPIPVEPSAAERDTTVILDPVEVDVDTEVWWTEE